ncbi:MAG TPA: tetratricopeptide repeat protein [Tepidisphaeraceae bacterium]|jgi:tetratricopeptide (TPR) repeat protein|nr:tetratricopeptide repeat protein [Tepidisphaeraceae bacterium]
MSRAKSDSGRGRWIAPLLVIFVGAVAYSNSLQGPFVLDDTNAILTNPQVRSLMGFRLPPSRPTAVSGRPMVIFSFAVNYAMAHGKVVTYHVTNLLIHLLAALFLYAVVRRTLARKELWGDRFAGSATWVSAMAAALWAAHPLDTQSVTYIAQRSESLASLFFLAAIYCVIRAADGGRRSARWWGVTAVIACGLGMGSKEIVAVLPIVAVLYDRTFLAGTFKKAFELRWKTYAGMAATWVLILFSLHMGSRESMVGFDHGVSPLDYARTELNVIALYLRLGFWPSKLVLDYYGWPTAWRWADVSWQGWLVLALAIATLAALWIRPWLGFLGTWFFLILAPTSSFLPIIDEAAAEQRMYLPLAAVVVLVVVCGWMLVRRWRWIRIVAALAGCTVVVCFVRLTMIRNGQYSTLIGIWRDTVTKRPNNTRAHMDFGEAWAQLSIDFPRGSPEAMDAARQAAQQFQIVMNLEPKQTQAIFALGQSLEQLGEPRAAEDLYTRSLAEHPEIAAYLYVERGNLRAQRQDWADAESDYHAAIALDRLDPEPHYFLAMVFEEKKDWSDARSELEKTVKLEPKYKDAAERLAKLERIEG